MRTEIQTYELIERYLSNSLSQKELTAFEQELSASPELMEEVATQQMIQNITIDNHLASIKEKTTQYNPYKNPTRPIGMSQYKKIAIAVLTVLSTTGILFFIGEKNWIATKSIVQHTEPISVETPKEEVAPIEINNKKQHFERESNESTRKNRSSKETIEGDEVTTQKVTETPEKTVAQTTKKEDKTVMVISTKQTIRFTNDTVVHNNSFVKELKNIELKTPCHTEHFKVKISVVPSCTNDKTGKISVGKITGGSAPYFTKLDKSTTFAEGQLFENLTAGEHILYIQDNEGCIYEHKIIVNSADCSVLKK